MIYRLQFTDAAREAVARFAPETKRNIKEGLRLLSQDPHSGEPLKRELEGKWKLRVGRYRIIYQVESLQKTLLIVAIGHRRHVYESLLF